MARRTVVGGMKWCNGPCGRQLPVGAFWTNGRGSPQPECKRCRSIMARDSYKDRYRKDPYFMRAERLRSKLRDWRRRRAAGATVRVPNRKPWWWAVDELREEALRLQPRLLALVGRWKVVGGETDEEDAVPVMPSEDRPTEGLIRERGWGGRDKGRPCGPRRCAEQGINPHAPEHVKGRREKLAEGRRIVAGLGPGWVADVFYNLQWCCIVRFHDHIEGKDFSVSSSYGGGYHALYSPWSATGGTPRAAVDAVVRQAEGYARSVARMAVLIQLAAKRARGRAA